jgi:hypothetical protein
VKVDVGNLDAENSQMDACDEDVEEEDEQWQLRLPTQDMSSDSEEENDDEGKGSKKTESTHVDKAEGSRKTESTHVDKAEGSRKTESTHVDKADFVRRLVTLFQTQLPYRDRVCNKMVSRLMEVVDEIYTRKMETVLIRGFMREKDNAMKVILTGITSLTIGSNVESRTDYILDRIQEQFVVKTI